jgi:large subunit ribosomal protein L2
MKYYNPTTSSLRHTVLTNNKLLKGKHYKSLVYCKKKFSGRNLTGSITVRHRGYSKNLYRYIDFKRSNFDGVPARVVSIEYDPNRSALIALVYYVNGIYSYILSPESLNIGDFISSGSLSNFKVGNSLQLKYIPAGFSIYNIELYPGKGGQLVRSAGCFGVLLYKNNSAAVIKINSTEKRSISLHSRVTIGVVSNSDYRYIQYGKAGRIRHLGFRPSVRGVAMNPLDHPHGGGEGKSSGGRPSVSKWSILTKGKKTRNKPTSKYLIKKL